MNDESQSKARSTQITAKHVFARIAVAMPRDGGLDEAFIRGLASRSLDLPAKSPPPDDEFEPWWEPANDDQIVEWWSFARRQFTDVHPDITEPTDLQVIGGQLFADRMGGD